MKISKRILTILLAVTLAFSVFAISASAVGTPTGAEAMTVIHFENIDKLYSLPT